ncbi:OmpW/AlkL family protein [Arenibaculum pallidiluteum]|uniref:OmpW/AlkL family protein n=1 Tax=Arenibaculum pallidiluteum TaxID=2812559 RepID=UPI001F46BB2B|nr:OmpW family protein [Arenibaculum pallidiluteum]
MAKFRYSMMATAAALGCMVAVSGAQAQVKGKSAGDFMVRARVLSVIPQEDGDIKDAAGNDTTLDVQVKKDTIPELDFTYFVTDNIALELIAGTSKHSVSVDPSGASLGSVRLLPPTLTAQYHFLPKSTFSPYVGAGLNYTIFFDEESGVADSISYENGFGVALQAGVDIFLTDNILLNVDVKKLWLDTDVSVSNGALRSKVDLNPWLVGVGVGYKF